MANDNTDMVSAFRVMLAITTLVILLVLFARLKVGYVIEYYLATLTLLFLLLTQYKALTWLLQPLTPIQNNSQLGKDPSKAGVHA